MHLGPLGFLRRSGKSYPPLAAPSEPHAPPLAAPEPAPAAPHAETPPMTPAVAAAQEPKPPVAEPAPPVALPFRSGRYGYGLTLQPCWRVEPPRSIAGIPAIDRFSGPDGLAVGVWCEPCALRSLPAVPPAERAVTWTIGTARRVPFVSYAPLNAARSRFLEGSWLAGGRRWMVHVQLPPVGVAQPSLDPVRSLLASFHRED